MVADDQGQAGNVVLHGRKLTFELVGELRRGGMGVVHLARVGVGNADRHVAIKVANSDDPLAAERFANEIALTRSLDHPGIVRILDDGTWQGRAWFAMTFVGSFNLADVLAVAGGSHGRAPARLLAGLDAGVLAALAREDRRGLAPVVAVALVRQIAMAVAHAHARGILHRDLKPANVLLGADVRPVLADFGIARLGSGSVHLTAEDEVVGTLGYLAPEILSGGDDHPRADVYALGALLYETLSGLPPPLRPQPGEPVPVRDEWPPGLERVLAHALEPVPERRCPSAGRLAEELRRVEAGRPVLAPPIRRWPQIKRWMRRHPALLVTAAILLLATGLGLASVVDRARRQAVTWPTVLFQRDLARDRSGLEVLAGTWRTEPGWGLAPAGNPDRDHDILGTRLPRRSGIRIEATVETRSTQEAGVFLGGESRWDDGYVFQLGAYENSGAMLRRNSANLWHGPQQIEPGRRYHLALEVVGDRIRAAIDGVVVVEVTDLLPTGGPLAGLVSYPVAEHVGREPVFRSIRVLAADLPELLPAAWVSIRLDQAQKAVRAGPASQLRALGHAHARGELARLPADDPRRPAQLLRAGQFIDAEAEPGLLAEHVAALAPHRVALGARPEYHIQHLRSVGPASTAGLARLDAAAGMLSPGDYRRLVAWVDRHLAVGEWPPVFARVEPHLPVGEPLRDYLEYRLAADQAATGEPDAAVTTLALLAARDTSSYWQRQAAARERGRELLVALVDGAPVAPIENYWQGRFRGSAALPVLDRLYPGHGLAANPVADSQSDWHMAVFEAALADHDFPAAPANQREREVHRLTSGSAGLTEAAGLQAAASLAGRVPVAGSRPWPFAAGQLRGLANELHWRALAAHLVVRPDDAALQAWTGWLQPAGEWTMLLVASARSFALHRRLPPGWSAASGPVAVRVAALEIPALDAVDDLPPARHPAVAWLDLVLARRFHEAGRPGRARACLERVAITPDWWPEAVVARRVLDRGWP